MQKPKGGEWIGTVLETGDRPTWLRSVWESMDGIQVMRPARSLDSRCNEEPAEGVWQEGHHGIYILNRVTLTFLKRLKEGKNRTHSENFDHSSARLWEFLASVQLLLSPRNQERMEIRRKWYHHTNSLKLLVWSYIWNGERIWQSGAVQLVCLQKLMPYRGGKCALKVAPLNPQRRCVESTVAGASSSCHLAIANSSVSPHPRHRAGLILSSSACAMM